MFDFNTCFETAKDYRVIAYYTHLIPTLITVSLAIFTLYKTRFSFLSKIFSSFAVTLCLWFIGNLIAWSSNNYDLVTFVWAPLDYLNVLFYILGAYFFLVLLRGKDIPAWAKLIFLGLAIPAWIITLFGHSVAGFNLPVCEAFNNDFLTFFKLSVESVLLALIVVSSIVGFWKGDNIKKKQIVLVAFALLLFFSVFSVTEYISSETGIYEINLYSLFVLPVFLFMIIYSITNQETFGLHLVGTQLLPYIMVIMAGAQFFFLDGLTDEILTSVTFLLSCGFAFLLVQSGKHEEKARIEIEKLAEELKTANEQQSVLIHFVTHQIKGFFTMSRNIFSLMLENTFGELNPGMKRMVQQGFDNTTKGVATVQEILNAANLKKGTVQMKMISFDARALVDEILADLNPRVVEKKLQLSTVLSSGPLVVVGDRFQLHEVYKNLVDNAIRYTPQGKITVTLEKQSNSVHFSVTDSGVGLSEDDKKRLFTEGGRGKDSLKVNVDSTGFGLFIAKGIVDAHKGHIWAESEGPGKGSTFSVDLPLVG